MASCYYSFFHIFYVLLCWLGCILVEVIMHWSLTCFLVPGTCLSPLCIHPGNFGIYFWVCNSMIFSLCKLSFRSPHTLITRDQICMVASWDHCRHSSGVGEDGSSLELWTALTQCLFRYPLSVSLTSNLSWSLITLLRIDLVLSVVQGAQQSWNGCPDVLMIWDR